jgi:hypothetical protein
MWSNPHGGKKQISDVIYGRMRHKPSIVLSFPPSINRDYPTDVNNEEKEKQKVKYESSPFLPIS